jgi:hypothetical protein
MLMLTFVLIHSRHSIRIDSRDVGVEVRIDLGDVGVEIVLGARGLVCDK